MANKYLEKIAGFSVGGAMLDGVKAIGRVAGKGVKAFGNQVYKATGGAYIDHAKKLGVKDPHKLSEYTNRAKLYRLDKKVNLDKTPTKEQVRAHFEKFKKETEPGLRKQQTDARIVVGAVSAGTAYGGAKIKQQLDKPKVQTYNY